MKSHDSQPKRQRHVAFFRGSDDAPNRSSIPSKKRRTDDLCIEIARLNLNDDVVHALRPFLLASRGLNVHGRATQLRYPTSLDFRALTGILAIPEAL